MGTKWLRVTQTYWRRGQTLAPKNAWKNLNERRNDFWLEMKLVSIVKRREFLRSNIDWAAQPTNRPFDGIARNNTVGRSFTI